MRAIEMQQIDQLPTTLGIVVRCASVLGESFTPPILYQLLPPNMVGSSVSLEAQLVSLEDAGLIEHMGSRFVAENQWKVPSIHPLVPPPLKCFVSRQRHFNH